MDGGQTHGGALVRYVEHSVAGRLVLSISEVSHQLVQLCKQVVTNTYTRGESQRIMETICTCKRCVAAEYVRDVLE